MKNNIFMESMQKNVDLAEQRRAKGLLPLTYEEGCDNTKPSDILYCFSHSYGGGLESWVLREKYHNLFWHDPTKAPWWLRCEHVMNEIARLFEKYDIKSQ